VIRITWAKVEDRKYIIKAKSPIKRLTIPTMGQIFQLFHGPSVFSYHQEGVKLLNIIHLFR
jgi:hypothetical protein